MSEFSVWDSHVLIVSGVHGCVEVGIFYVGCHEFCVRGGDDAVEEAFDCADVRCFRADIAAVFKAIATNSVLNTEWVGLFWAMCADNA
jgi:hypothetical protein